MVVSNSSEDDKWKGECNSACYGYVLWVTLIDHDNNEDVLILVVKFYACCYGQDQVRIFFLAAGASDTAKSSKYNADTVYLYTVTPLLKKIKKKEKFGVPITHMWPQR